MKFTKEELKAYMETLDELIWWFYGFKAGNPKASVPDEDRVTLIICYNLLKEKLEAMK